MLNYRNISQNQIEAEMLTQTKISLSIKFSTHSKDVSITVQDGRDNYTLNHAEKHYKTGTTQKRDPTKLQFSDMQSMGGKT